MSYNSKYTGAQVENLLDQVANGNTGGGGGGVTTETDPVFSASPAAEITDENISEWNGKVDKVEGKQLSTEDFTTALKTKLEGLSNYDDTTISQAIDELRTDFDTLVSGDTTTAIKTFNEVIAFLDGLEDTESLDAIIASIEQQIAGKQEKLVSGVNIKTINGQSILGEGNIVIEGGSSSGGTSSGSSAYPLVKIKEEGALSVFLEPNTFYILDAKNTISLGLSQEVEGVANEYLFQVVCRDSPISFPEGIAWANGEPSIKYGKIYQFSILNSIGVFCEIDLYFKFNVDGNELTAERYMTWEDFVNSSFNTIGLYVEDGYVYSSDAIRVWYEGAPVFATELIYENLKYLSGGFDSGN